jgi:hypothetical protein
MPQAASRDGFRIERHLARSATAIAQSLEPTEYVARVELAVIIPVALALDAARPATAPARLRQMVQSPHT